VPEKKLDHVDEIRRRSTLFVLNTRGWASVVPINWVAGAVQALPVRFQELDVRGIQGPITPASTVRIHVPAVAPL